MEKQTDVYMAIKAIVVYLESVNDTYMVADSPYFPLARAVILDGHLARALNKDCTEEVV